MGERRRKPDGCLATIQSPSLPLEPSRQASLGNQVAAHNPSSYWKCISANNFSLFKMKHNNEYRFWSSHWHMLGGSVSLQMRSEENDTMRRGMGKYCIPSNISQWGSVIYPLVKASYAYESEHWGLELDCPDVLAASFGSSIRFSKGRKREF